ncbi:MAG TPA: glycosyltransferase family 4 protein [Planctomycetota bacterium]|nr:glycosyltransferase family 4 protein [Planctomycetota bacterium]
MAAPPTDDGTLRVVRVITRLNVGGPTRHVAALMAGLDPARFRQTLAHGLAPADEGPDLLPAPGPRVAIPELVRAPSPLRDARAYRRLRRLFREIRPHVVHTHQGKAGAVGRFAAAAEGVPVVVHTHHGLVFDGYFSRVGRALYRRVERAAARRSTRLVAQADAQRDALVRELGPEVAAKIRIVPPGVDVAAFRAPARGPREGTVRRILCPIRLAPVKDPRLALETLRRLPERFSLTFRGDGPLRAALAAEIAGDPRLRGRAEILPPTADLREGYAAADVVLLTSVSEGTPLCLIESQLAGTPAVTTDVGAARSLLAPGGGVAVPRDADALAAAIVAAAERPASPAAQSEVARRFGVERLCRDVAALYEEAVAEALSALRAP